MARIAPPPRFALLNLGLHRLEDMVESETVYQRGAALPVNQLGQSKAEGASWSVDFAMCHADAAADWG